MSVIQLRDFPRRLTPSSKKQIAASLRADGIIPLHFGDCAPKERAGDTNYCRIQTNQGDKQLGWWWNGSDGELRYYIAEIGLLSPLHPLNGWWKQGYSKIDISDFPSNEAYEAYCEGHSHRECDDLDSLRDDRVGMSYWI